MVQFEIGATLNGWSEEEKAMQLATSSSGQARGPVSDLDVNSRLHFNILVTKVEEQFEPRMVSA